MTITSRDQILRVNYDGIPDILKERGRFGVWCSEPNPDTGEYGKPPYNWKTGTVGNSLDFTELFDDICEIYETEQTADGRNYDGINLYTAGGISCIDLDNCTTAGGSICDWVYDIIYKLGAYAERSVSGKGVHIFFTYKKEPANPNPEHFKRYFKNKIEYKDPITGQTGTIETYLSGYNLKPFTITGHEIPYMEYDPENIAVSKQKLRAFLKEYTLNETYTSRRADLSDRVYVFRDPRLNPLPLDGWTDEKLINTIRSTSGKANFDRLFNSDPNEETADHSAVDQALVNLLLWWTGLDPNRTIQLLYKSSRYREKWKNHRTYLRMTLRSGLIYLINENGNNTGFMRGSRK